MNLISDTYTNRTFRPKLFAAGIFVGIIALLLLSFEDMWEPVVYQFLARQESLRFVSGLVPYFGILAVLFSGFLIFRSKQRPVIATEEQIDGDGP